MYDRCVHGCANKYTGGAGVTQKMREYVTPFAYAYIYRYMCTRCNPLVDLQLQQHAAGNNYEDEDSDDSDDVDEDVSVCYFYTCIQNHIF